MNNPDRLLNEELSSASSIERSLGNVKFDEVIFLSKHCAASGKASLTVHPIGEQKKHKAPQKVQIIVFKVVKR